MHRRSVALAIHAPIIPKSVAQYPASLSMAGQAHAHVVVSPPPNQARRIPNEPDSQNTRQETIGPGPVRLPSAGRANRCGGAQSRGCNAALRRRKLSRLPVRFQSRRRGRFCRRLFCGDPINPVPCLPGTSPVRFRTSPGPQRPRSTPCLIPSGTARSRRALRDPVRRRLTTPNHFGSTFFLSGATCCAPG